jgi:membrane protease YdiL (CAAX protease family)
MSEALPAEPPKPVSKLRWAVHLLLMAALPLIAGFVPIRTRVPGPMLGHTVPRLLEISALEVLAFAVPFLIAWLFSRASKDELLLRWRPGFWVVPLGVLYSIAIRAGIGILAAVIVAFVMIAQELVPAPQGPDPAPPRQRMEERQAKVEHYIEENRPHVEKLVDVKALSTDSAYYWTNILIVSFIIGGLREEIWRSAFLAGLRGIAPAAFGSRGGKLVAVALAAVIFGAGHYPQGPLAVGAITILGFFLGLIMLLHRSIWPSVFTHGLFDAVSLALLPWAMERMQHLPHPL